MQTRQLRLGDVVDDYCPRERRLSNHVIVAMVEDAIKQTRCSTCDFEHPYKEAKVPPRRKKKDAPSALYQQVLEGVMEGRTLARGAASGVSSETAPSQPDAPAAPAPPKRRSARASAVTEEPPAPAAPAPILRGVLRPAATPQTPSTSAPAAAAPGSTAAPDSSSPIAASSGSSDAPSLAAAPAAAHAPSAAVPAAAAPADEPQAPAAPAAEEDADGPLYRRNLIRATLPRPVGEAPVRQIPSFTIREAAAARPGKFRHKQRPQGMGAAPGARQGRPNGVGGNQTRQSAGRGPQAGRPGGGKKTGGAPQHGGQAHGGKNRQGGHGNKRFK